MTNLEIKVLSLIVNELANLTIRRDRNYYRLQLTIKDKNLPNLHLNYFINDLNKNSNYYFNYDNCNNRYYIYGSKVIELLELLQDDLLSIPGSLSIKVYKVLINKELFTRTKGKKYTEEELNKLEQLYLEFNEQN